MLLPNDKQLEGTNASIVLLSPSQQDDLDQSRNCRNILEMRPKEPEDSFFAEKSTFWPDDFDPFTLHVSQANTLGPRHEPYVRYLHEMQSKIGRQGGMFDQRTHLDIILSYYVPGCIGAIPSRLILARDLFISMIRQKIESEGYPQYDKIALFKAFAGLPTGLQKGTFAAETLGVNKTSIQRFFPTTPGQRRMRSKDRGIFMDAVANVRAQQRYLTAARKWLRSHFPEFFGSWVREDIVVRPKITNSILRRHGWVYWDYKSMDVNFRKRIAMELIYPVYETLFPELALQIGCHFEQNFDQPIFCGNYLLTGEHSLLSGANITNDFETIFTVILVLAVVMDKKFPDTIVALGDDMALAGRYSDKELREILDLAVELAGLLDMKISVEKSGISREEITYCRKTYYPAAKRDLAGIMIGAYPINLCWNNIVQPEEPHHKASVSLAADLQRLDNAYGSPDYGYAVQLFAKYNLYGLNSKTDWSSLSKDLTKAEIADWWSRLYGERWNPTTSITFRSLARLFGTFLKD